MKTHVYIKTCTQKFIVPLFKIAPNQEQSKCSSAAEMAIWWDTIQ